MKIMNYICKCNRNNVKTDMEEEIGNKLNLGQFVNEHSKIWDFVFELYILENSLKSEEFRYFYLGSLISSDAVYDIETANNSIKRLKFIKDNLKYLNLDKETFKEIIKFVNKGLKIVKRDLKEFKEDNTD